MPTGKKKIEIAYVKNPASRQITYSKRKRTLLKHSLDLSILTGCDAVMLLISEQGRVASFATPRLRWLVESKEAEKAIAHCYKDTPLEGKIRRPKAKTAGEPSAGEPDANAADENEG